MARLDALTRYIRIIQKLKRNPADFQQIADYLEQESEISGLDLHLSQRTLQRDIIDIRTIFGIDIVNNRSTKKYYIADDEPSEMTDRMMEAFDTFNALNISERLSAHIHFESRKPQGTENLYPLLNAIRKKVRVRFAYYNFEDDITTQREADPYALKEFRNRWYLLARESAEEPVKSFALDRLSELEVTKKRLCAPGDEFDVHQHYKHSFGIIASNGAQPEEIVLSFAAFQGMYIKSLPLHATQEIIEDNDDELRIRLRLCITHDFVMELLSYGAELKVIAPQALAARVKEEHLKAAQRY
jgi:predicted DNA-binding transcriptional regulator YafY